jgi:hypothetical protein
LTQRYISDVVRLGSSPNEIARMIQEQVAKSKETGNPIEPETETKE